MFVGTGVCINCGDGNVFNVVTKSCDTCALAITGCGTTAASCGFRNNRMDSMLTF